MPLSNNEEIKAFSVSDIPMALFLFVVQNEFWMSLAEFEAQLKEQITGYELKMMRQNSLFLEKEAYIKAKCAVKMDMQDIAFREYKLMMRKQLDQTMMQLADVESKMAQMFNHDGNFDSLFSLDKNIDSIEEAMSVIFKLKNGLANVLSENRKLEGDILDLNMRIEELTKEKVRNLIFILFRIMFKTYLIVINNQLIIMKSHYFEL